MKYRISVSDCFTTSESILESKSGYFSIEDIFAIIEANTDLFRELPKPQPPKEEAELPTSTNKAMPKFLNVEAILRTVEKEAGHPITGDYNRLVRQVVAIINQEPRQ